MVSEARVHNQWRLLHVTLTVIITDNCQCHTISSVVQVLDILSIAPHFISSHYDHKAFICFINEIKSDWDDSCVVISGIGSSNYDLSDGVIEIPSSIQLIYRIDSYDLIHIMNSKHLCSKVLV